MDGTHYPPSMAPWQWRKQRHQVSLTVSLPLPQQQNKKEYRKSLLWSRTNGIPPVLEERQPHFGRPGKPGWADLSKPLSLPLQTRLFNPVMLLPSSCFLSYLAKHTTGSLPPKMFFKWECFFLVISCYRALAMNLVVEAILTPFWKY